MRTSCGGSAPCSALFGRATLSIRPARDRHNRRSGHSLRAMGRGFCTPLPALARRLQHTEHLGTGPAERADSTRVLGGLPRLDVSARCRGPADRWRPRPLSVQRGLRQSRGPRVRGQTDAVCQSVAARNCAWSGPGGRTELDGGSALRARAAHGPSARSPTPQERGKRARPRRRALLRTAPGSATFGPGRWV